MARFRIYTKRWIAREKPAQKSARAAEIVRQLAKSYRGAKIALKYGNSMQLLAAVILSAQCTDKKVNEVTAKLFRKYVTAHDFANADQKRFEGEIRAAGFYRAKAKNIIAAAKRIENVYCGKLPQSMAEMLTLAGVARKTANVVLGNASGIVEGIAVDTHVSRISQRLGLTKYGSPTKIERDLMQLLPKKYWFKITYYLIAHGRAVCTARSRKCMVCPLRKICPSSLV